MTEPAAAARSAERSSGPARGRLYAGTSGFAYPGWAPRFYPADLAADRFLAAYAARLPACELNNTYYRWPTADRIRAWASETPPSFRFTVKAQRASAWRGLSGDPGESVARLVAPLPAFGPRLGCVLFRVPEELGRDDAGLARLLAVWPPSVPLTLELQHPSWQADETFDLLRSHAVVLCATELPDDETPPTLRLTGPFLYLRLRRHDYSEAELRAWARRLEPFLAAGRDVFAFFRHDPVGRGAELAVGLLEAAAGLAA